MSHGQRRERINPNLRYLLVLACGHWRQAAQPPTGTLYPCGRSRACQDPCGSTPRHVLRVVDLLAESKPVSWV